MMETWQELKVTVKREGEELVSNLLIELGAQGVAIEDSMDYVGNVDRFGEIFPDVEQQEEIVVTAYYPDTIDIAAVEADLQTRLSELTDFMDLGEVKMGTSASISTPLSKSPGATWMFSIPGLSSIFS